MPSRPALRVVLHIGIFREMLLLCVREKLCASQQPREVTIERFLIVESRPFPWTSCLAISSGGCGLRIRCILRTQQFIRL